VHLLTASGAAIALLALLAAFRGSWVEMFAWLGLALLIDGVDGPLARRARVAEFLPRWSGDVLDLVVDYLNYVLVPAIAVATAGLMPQPWALIAAAAILVASAIYFSDRRMKTDDAYFHGFPALWNVVVFYLFLTRPSPLVTGIAVAVFVALTFAPVHFVHPLRTRKWLALNIALLAAWGVLALVALYYHLAPPLAVTAALVALALYFLVAGLARPRAASG
jgi:phosphatidylcholine synthase